MQAERPQARPSRAAELPEAEVEGESEVEVEGEAEA